MQRGLAGKVLRVAYGNAKGAGQVFLDALPGSAEEGGAIRTVTGDTGVQGTKRKIVVGEAEEIRFPGQERKERSQWSAGTSFFLTRKPDQTLADEIDDEIHVADDGRRRMREKSGVAAGRRQVIPMVRVTVAGER